MREREVETKQGRERAEIEAAKKLRGMRAMRRVIQAGSMNGTYTGGGSVEGA